LSTFHVYECSLGLAGAMHTLRDRAFVVSAPALRAVLRMNSKMLADAAKSDATSVADEKEPYLSVYFEVLAVVWTRLLRMSGFFDPAQESCEVSHAEAGTAAELAQQIALVWQDAVPIFEPVVHYQASTKVARMTCNPFLEPLEGPGVKASGLGRLSRGHRLRAS